MKQIEAVIIGDLKLANNIFLAPMAGITDLPFRLICREFGAGLVYTEMVSAKGLFYNDSKTHQYLKTDSMERPVALQLFGKDPDIIERVLETTDIENFDILDLNFGCPAPKVTRNGEGSALMKEPKLLASIVRSASAVSKLPVTVKIRRGWDENSENAVEISKRAEEAGASAITVHGRYAKQFYSGEANWDIIAEVKKNVGIPVIGNGDIKDFSSFRRLREKTGCDAVMIGRAARGNPWIFKSIYEQNESHKQRSVKETVDMIKRHSLMVMDVKGEYIAVREMRKHIGWYLKGIKNSSAVKNLIYKCDRMVDVITILEEKLIFQDKDV